MKGEKIMATSTFDRKIEITDMESLKKLMKIMSADAPKPISEHPFSDNDRKRGEQLLDQWLSHSNR